MKYLAFAFSFFFITALQAQDSKLLLEQTLIEDWAEYPIYSELVVNPQNNTSWKDKYAYMDSIDVYRIAYLSDGLKVTGFLARPKAEGKYPCIIFNRGGNRDFGALKVAHGAILLGQLAAEGYVVIASNYRGNSGGEGQEEFGGADVNDVLILPEVLDEIKGADTSRIGMYGWSRGGMMTYIALTKTDRIKAAVVGGAVSDLGAMIEDRPAMESDVVAELVPNYSKKTRVKALNDRSAVKWPDRFSTLVPILILHGNADWRVKPSQSLNMAAALGEHQVPYRLIIYEGGDHGISEHKEEVNQEVIDWFNRFLKEGEAIPTMEFHGK